MCRNPQNPCPGRWAPFPHLCSACKLPPPYLCQAASSAGKQEVTHLKGGRKGLPGKAACPRAVVRSGGRRPLGPGDGGGGLGRDPQAQGGVADRSSRWHGLGPGTRFPPPVLIRATQPQSQCPPGLYPGIPHPEFCAWQPWEGDEQSWWLLQSGSLFLEIAVSRNIPHPQRHAPCTHQPPGRKGRGRFHPLWQRCPEVIKKEMIGSPRVLWR